MQGNSASGMHQQPHQAVGPAGAHVIVPVANVNFRAQHQEAVAPSANPTLGWQTSFGKLMALSAIFILVNLCWVWCSSALVASSSLITHS